MLYAVICIDKPGRLETRRANRDAHLEHIRAAGGAIRQAGPLLDPEGEMAGSLLIFEAEDIAEVERWCAGDPYAEAGLFGRVEIRPWKRVIG
jgi:hypothetical protein